KNAHRNDAAQLFVAAERTREDAPPREEGLRRCVDRRRRIDEGSRGGRDEGRRQREAPPQEGRSEDSSMVSARSTCPLSALAYMVVVSSCTKDLGIMDTKFRCASDQDCIDGWVCDPNAKICMLPVDDAGVAAMDASTPPGCGFTADFTHEFDSR